MTPKDLPRRERDRVLIVDDDAVTRQMILDFLAEHGFESAGFDNAKEALESIKAHRPQLIISDWEMPGMDGLELCREVRALNLGSHMHFIMLTVHASKAELSQAFDAGVDDFLAKPFDEVELMARLRSGLRAAAFYDEVLRQTQGSRQLNEQLMNLNHRLENLAITDDLTGLYNRREAMRRLDEQWTLSDRYQRPFDGRDLGYRSFQAAQRSARALGGGHGSSGGLRYVEEMRPKHGYGMPNRRRGISDHFAVPDDAGGRICAPSAAARRWRPGNSTIWARR